jgi:phosphoribosylamine--glycine ligase
MNDKLTVLIIGSGGREHALLRACQKSPLCSAVHAAPGNGGMQTEAPCHPLDIEDPVATVALARSINADLVIIGPEAPLAAGVADALREAGISTYGPGRAGAVLEASKAACKAFFDRHGIPTAKWETFTDLDTALAHLDSVDFPVVVKASGLAAGKGVIICGDRPVAEEAVRSMLLDNAFGTSGHQIVIEEFLDGQEVSLMVMVSGDNYVCLPPSQDHKRIGDGDTGPNTGGMGAFAPALIADEAVMRIVRTTIIEPTLAGFRAEGIDYRGTLFIGLILDRRGQPKVLEFNVRFGDPECQVLLPLCETDPLALIRDCANGTLQPDEVRIRQDAALIVVLAAKGYPGPYTKGDHIQLPACLPPSVEIIHAGTRLDGESLVSAGGRVLGVVAIAPSLAEAAHDAYKVCDQIVWPNKVFRRDIGHHQLNSSN